MTDMVDTMDMGGGAAAGAVAPSAFRPAVSRAQAAAMRQAEREGVPFWCHKTGFEARVKVLSLADSTMLAGIPATLQAQLTASLTGADRRERGRGFSELLRAVADDEALANAFCCAGFVSPRLVLTEDELDGSDDVWLVTDLHVEERKKYLGVVMGTEREEMARIAKFLRERLAGDAADGAVPAAAAAERAAGDGGGGVRAEGAAGVRPRGGGVRRAVRGAAAGDGGAAGAGAEEVAADGAGSEVHGG